MKITCLAYAPLNRTWVDQQVSGWKEQNLKLFSLANNVSYSVLMLVYLDSVTYPYVHSLIITHKTTPEPAHPERKEKGLDEFAPIHLTYYSCSRYLPVLITDTLHKTPYSVGISICFPEENHWDLEVL